MLYRPLCSRSPPGPASPCDARLQVLEAQAHRYGCALRSVFSLRRCSNQLCTPMVTWLSSASTTISAASPISLAPPKTYESQPCGGKNLERRAFEMGGSGTSGPRASRKRRGCVWEGVRVVARDSKHEPRGVTYRRSSPKWSWRPLSTTAQKLWTSRAHSQQTSLCRSWTAAARAG